MTKTYQKTMLNGQKTKTKKPKNQTKKPKNINDQNLPKNHVK